MVSKLQIVERGKNRLLHVQEEKLELKKEEKLKIRNQSTVFFVYFFCIICSKPKTNKFLNRMHMIV